MKKLLCLLVLAAPIAQGDDIPTGPDDEHRQIVETVSHPDYCKDENGKPITGRDCIEKSVREVHGDAKKNESESMADAINKNLEKKKQKATLEPEPANEPAVKKQ